MIDYARIEAEIREEYDPRKMESILTQLQSLIVGMDVATPLTERTREEQEEMTRNLALIREHAFRGMMVIGQLWGDIAAAARKQSLGEVKGLRYDELGL